MVGGLLLYDRRRSRGRLGLRRQPPMIPKAACDRPLEGSDAFGFQVGMIGRGDPILGTGRVGPHRAGEEGRGRDQGIAVFLGSELGGCQGFGRGFRGPAHRGQELGRRLSRT